MPVLRIRFQSSGSGICKFNATSLLLNLLPKGECHMKRHIEYHICYILYKKQKTRHIHTCRIFLHWWRRMDSDHRSWKATDLQSAPFGHSGTPPYVLPHSRSKLVSGVDRELFPNTKLRVRQKQITCWSWWTDLNPWPADYKSAALPTELHQHIQWIFSSA